MSANLAQMPIKGSNKAPTFDGKTDELVEFLENVSDLADAAGLKDQLKIKACLKYASRDEVEAWETCPETAGSDFAKFVTAIKELYPGCDSKRKYFPEQLIALTEEQSATPMLTLDDNRKAGRVAQ